MSFSKLHYKVPTLTGLTQFYSNVLGMQDVSAASEITFEFSEGACRLNFQPSDTEVRLSKPDDLYWKIGITVGNLDRAVEWLRRCNWNVSEPRQFRDIGYMCHLFDPNGFAIELLQQGFEGSEVAVVSGHPIAGQATLAHITLRVTDVEAAKKYCETELGLKLLSVQPVSDLGFSLYFYSFEREIPPNPNITSVENREWLWRRPYTVLELQHLEGEGSRVCKTETGHSGLHGISIKREGEAETFLPSDALEFNAPRS